jgi:hypothetical protein
MTPVIKDLSLQVTAPNEQRPTVIGGGLRDFGPIDDPPIANVRSQLLWDKAMEGSIEVSDTAFWLGRILRSGTISKQFRHKDRQYLFRSCRRGERRLRPATKEKPTEILNPDQQHDQQESFCDSVWTVLSVVWTMDTHFQTGVIRSGKPPAKTANAGRISSVERLRPSTALTTKRPREGRVMEGRAIRKRI